MVHTREQQEKEKKLEQRNEGMTEHRRNNNPEILGTYEEIYGTKETIDVKEVLKKSSDSTKKVLVLGRAGIGKSTFCQYVTHQWAKSKLWSQYELLILIRLRKLTEDNYPAGKRFL